MSYKHKQYNSSFNKQNWHYKWLYTYVYNLNLVGIFLICYMLGKIHKMHKMKQIFQNLMPL